MCYPEQMKGQIQYAFSAKVWQHAAPGGWYFVSLPTDISTEIRANLGWQEEGWGRLKASAKIGTSQWETAIWFDNKHQTYLLPLKAAVRKKEQIESNEDVDILIWV